MRQIKEKVFQFSREHTSSRNDDFEFYLLNHPDGRPLKLLKKTNEDSFEMALEINFRPYFLIQSKQGRYIIAERTLPVDGMNNFRDMGGYRSKNNKRVKWGLLYRSDHIYNASEKGLDYLRKLNIGTIIDYRSENEIHKYPNPILDTCTKTYHLDPSAHVAELAAQFQSSKENEDKNLINNIIKQQSNGTLKDHSEVIALQYRNFVNSMAAKKSYSQMLQIVANTKNGAIVQHCRGGKDRTGFGALLLLGVLGVSQEDIIKDYMITAKNREKRNHIKMEGYKRLTSDRRVLDHLYSFIDTKPEFIATSLETIIDQYGSIEEYAQDELNIRKDTINILKEKYLE
ncbi:tyrosine-protein phosphatase [Aerococcus loyolae]|uniref:tyrosine-protein phosphatase n=1 Tax=Aerococcus loyolae TaxID=2976809 RepID=UPI00215C3FF5|nr:tyrosine-protein phosphatase [Aerococcus loyolae]MDK6231621.1 tyrosine-protein phosphatase [Aerococcus urinae]